MNQLPAISEKVPSYGDNACSLALGQRELALLEKTSPVDLLRLMRASAANARAFKGLGSRVEAAKRLKRALAIPTTGPTAAVLRARPETGRRQLRGALRS